MIINEIPSDPPTTPTRIPRRFFANQPPPPPPRIIEEVPNNAPGKTLAELFASFNQIRQVSTDTNNHYFPQNGPVLTHTEPNLSHVDVNAARPTTPNAPTSSYNPTQHIGTPPRLWFPPRPPGQDIDGNTSIPDNPWTPPPFSAVMEDAPRTPSAPRSQSVSMPDQIRTPISKFRSFFSDFFTTTTNVPVESVRSNIFNPEIQPARRHSGINSHLPHPYREQPTERRILATAPVLLNPPTSTPKYVNPFLAAPLTLPLRTAVPPRSSPENVSPRTPTAPAPQFPDAPFPDLISQPFRVPATVHVLADWPYGPLLDNMSPRTRRFAVSGTDADGNDLKIYQPQLSRDTYLECLPPDTRVEVHCGSRACGAVCELDGRAGACRQRSTTANDAAQWEPRMWMCEGCGEEMEMEVLKDNEENSPTDTEDACCKMDEQEG